MTHVKNCYGSELFHDSFTDADHGMGQYDSSLFKGQVLFKGNIMAVKWKYMYIKSFSPLPLDDQFEQKLSQGILG